ncbi:hypothetical protein [Metabacillus arenae]|uniref:Uncharacterized protein n=1 Tax=Metabacillus arenae TaxID=2771434 RepID=A0A926RWN8_9BACI|nr:hypothetical protein [Metabacillus arenae]MBD1379775.1 hypothetical protein [Metabacillus arenae]
MGQLYKFHEMEADQDLRDKAAHFKYLLEQMSTLGREMKNIIRQELEHSSGEIIKEINEAILQHQMKNEATISEQLVAMDSAAPQYTHYINNMNKQYVTLYYKEKEIQI